jgi:hypothetical protein
VHNEHQTLGALEPPLPRRDYVLLPLLSILTVVVMFSGAEILARFFWPAGEKGYCVAFDPTVGPHGKPNCTAMNKLPETEWVTYKFNKCGYRSEAACGPKPADAIRIAILGSSIAEGYVTAYDDMFSTRAVKLLSRSCRRNVEFQNLGIEGSPPIYAYRHMDEALRLKADLIALPISPWDVEEGIDPHLMAIRKNAGPIGKPAVLVHLNPVQKVQALVHDSRVALVAQHFMLQNRQTFLKLYLVAGGDHTDFVRVPFTPAWEKRFADIELLFGEMADKAHAAGVPFMLIGVPERAQAMMARAPDLPAGVDPYAYDRRLSEIAARHGILYVDVLKAIAASAVDPQELFYIVDGHPTARAHAVIAEALAKELLGGRVGVFSACGGPNP